MHDHLKKNNILHLTLDKNCTPMVYPFISSDACLRQKLIENKIFVATYWPNLLNFKDVGSVEFQYASQLIPLPVDQRYGLKEMERIVEQIAL